MRLTRRLIASFFAISLVTAGTAARRRRARRRHDAAADAVHVDAVPAGRTPRLCKAANATGGNGKVTLAHPLKYTKSGIIDAAAHRPDRGQGRDEAAGEGRQGSCSSRRSRRSRSGTTRRPRRPTASSRSVTASPVRSTSCTGTGSTTTTSSTRTTPSRSCTTSTAQTGTKQLEAAMYILPDKYTLAEPAEEVHEQPRAVPRARQPVLRPGHRDDRTAGSWAHAGRRHVRDVVRAAAHQVQPEHPGARLDPGERVRSVRVAARRRRRSDQGRARSGRACTTPTSVGL